MTKENILLLIAWYAGELAAEGEQDPVLTKIASRFPVDGDLEKAHRWLGFIQGVCYAKELWTLEGLRSHLPLWQVLANNNRLSLWQWGQLWSWLRQSCPEDSMLLDGLGLTADDARYLWRDAVLEHQERQRGLLENVSA